MYIYKHLLRGGLRLRRKGTEAFKREGRTEERKIGRKNVRMEGWTQGRKEGQQEFGLPEGDSNNNHFSI